MSVDELSDLGLAKTKNWVIWITLCNLSIQVIKVTSDSNYMKPYCCI